MRRLGYKVYGACPPRRKAVHGIASAGRFVHPVRILFCLGLGLDCELEVILYRWLSDTHATVIHSAN
jgi:hypothetical protein